MVARRQTHISIIRAKEKSAFYYKHLGLRLTSARRRRVKTADVADQAHLDVWCRHQSASSDPGVGIAEKVKGSAIEASRKSCLGSALNAVAQWEIFPSESASQP